MHGAQERKFTARTGPSIAHSGPHMVNKLLTVLLLRVPMSRASVGRLFHEDKAVRSSYSKTRIMPYSAMFNCPVRDITSCMGACLITIFSAYIVTQSTSIVPTLSHTILYMLLRFTTVIDHRHFFVHMPRQQSVIVTRLFNNLLSNSIDYFIARHL